MRCSQREHYKIIIFYKIHLEYPPGRFHRRSVLEQGLQAEDPSNRALQLSAHTASLVILCSTDFMQQQATNNN